MRKLADSGQQNKTLIGLSRFDDAEKTFQFFQYLVNFRIGHISENRFVVFVNQNDNFFVFAKSQHQFPKLSLGI